MRMSRSCPICSNDGCGSVILASPCSKQSTRKEADRPNRSKEWELGQIDADICRHMPTNFGERPRSYPTTVVQVSALNSNWGLGLAWASSHLRRMFWLLGDRRNLLKLLHFGTFQVKSDRTWPKNYDILIHVASNRICPGNCTTGYRATKQAVWAWRRDKNPPKSAQAASWRSFVCLEFSKVTRIGTPSQCRRISHRTCIAVLLYCIILRCCSMRKIPKSQRICLLLGWLAPGRSRLSPVQTRHEITATEGLTLQTIQFLHICHTVHIDIPIHQITVLASVKHSCSWVKGQYLYQMKKDSHANSSSFVQNYSKPENNQQIMQISSMFHSHEASWSHLRRV